MIIEAAAAAVVLALGRRLTRLFTGGSPADPEAPDPQAPDPQTPDLQAPDPEDPVDREVRHIDRMLAVTGAGLGLSLTGVLGVPAASLLAMPVLAGPLLGMWWHTWTDYRETGTVGFKVMMSSTGVVLVASGGLSTAGLGIFIFNCGRRAVLLSRRRAHETLASAFGDWGADVVVVRDGIEVEIALADVKVDDILVLEPGRPVPTDGEIIDGTIAVDQRMFTGESRLAEATPGDHVMAATLVVAGRALVRAERTGSDTHAARLDELIHGVESYEQGVSHRALAVADRTLGPTVGVAVLAAIAHGPVGLVGGVWGNSVDLFYASAPTSMLQTIRSASGGGILIKDGRSLDLLADIDTIVFDKTGTLTLDSFEVAAVHGSRTLDPEALLRFAAAAEGRHQHPIARAIVAEAAERGLDPSVLATEDPSVRAGLGLRVVIDGDAVLLGSRRLLETAGVELTEEAQASTTRAERSGHTVVHLALGQRYAGSIELRPRVRPEARRVVEQMHRRGLEVAILTGDEEEPTRRLAESLGIDSWFSRTLPEGKEQHIADLQAAGRRVCFVGDGINDALAMRRAHISVSMSGASTVAVDSAQIVLRDGSIARLDSLFEIGRRHRRVQGRLLTAALVPTVISMSGVLLAGIPVAAVLGIHAAGLGASLGIVVHQQRTASDGVEDPPTGAAEGPEPAGHPGR